ncbi:MAG: hypothetical protein HZB40_13585 [Rhodocyclales bacterium]|nr:hypothetical protein [Rhodocyclales bacterium]
MNTPLATWSPAIETGLPDIDAQCKQLFDLAASFRGDGDQILNGWFYQHVLTVDAAYVAVVKAGQAAGRT